MAKQQILLVDADSSSARLLEVSLRSAGFTVATAVSAESALSKLEHGAPDLILTDTRLPGADGFAFVRKLRARPELVEVPVVFLTEQGALDDKLRGLELGVDDYLAKPIMVREVVTRVQLLLARKKQQRIAAEPAARTRFSGSLEDVAVVDLLQTIAVSGKSGIASVKRGEREAWLYFDKGQIIDAEVGDLHGEEAVYRTITWTTGFFDLEFRAIDRLRVIDVPHQALLMEGLRRVDELGRLAEQLPPEGAIVDVDHEALASRLNEIPDELNGILRLIDGKRTLVDLIDASPFDDLSTLTVLSKFYFEGLLLSTNPEPVEWAPGSQPSAVARRDSAFPAAAAQETLAPTLVPPSRAAQPPPSSAASVDPVRESQRLTPPPPSSRAPAAEAGAKLTPKGIVNVGDATPPPPKQMPSPFRVAHDAPRRSPIPMPDGAPRSNGVAGNGLAAAMGNGVRESRTIHGLHAAVPREPVIAGERPTPPPPSSRPAPTSDVSGSSDEQRRANTRASAATTIDAGDAPTRISRLALESSARSSEPAAGEPPTRPGSMLEPAAHSAPNTPHVPGSTPASNPESEHEFFEAGDEGTYAGGPRSGLPVQRFAHELEEPIAEVRRPPVAGRRTRARRSLLVVAGILLLAAVPLVVAAWRHLTTSREPSVTAEASSMASQQLGSGTVKQPGEPGDTVAPTPGAVSPAPDVVPLAADAGPSIVADGAAPRAASAASEPSASEPALLNEPAASAAPASAAPPRPKAPAVRSTPPAAPAAKPDNPVELPFIPPFKTAPPSAPELRPGEKPPTAAYPLR